MSYTQKNIRNGHIDWFILLGVLGMMFFSLAFVYSASADFAGQKTGSSETFFWAHAVRVMLSVAIMLVFSRIDYHWLERWSKPLLIVSVGMLVYVLFDGTRMKGATRWINAGFVSFQPSELAKFALVWHLGVMIAGKRQYLKSFTYGFLPMILWVVVVCGLIALQPNFSTSLVVFLVASGLMFIGRVRIKHLAAVGAVGLVVACVYAASAPYRMQRIASFIGMHTDEAAMVSDTARASHNYQLNQALLAFGSGGWLGVGPGHSRQRLFLPEPFGDFIYAIIGEEYGLAGTVLLLAVFGIIVWRGMIAARHAPDDLGRMVAAGVTLIVGSFAVINAAVTTGLLPTTGLPMPFISYGGSSAFFSAAAVGLLLNVSQSANVMPAEEEPVRMAAGATA